MILTFYTQTLRTYLSALLNTARLFKEEGDKSYDVAFSVRTDSDTINFTSSITHQFVQSTFAITTAGEHPSLNFSGLLKVTYLQNIVDKLKDHQYVAISLSECRHFVEICEASLQAADLISESAIQLHNAKTHYRMQVKPNDHPVLYDFPHEMNHHLAVSVSASEGYKFKALRDLMQLEFGSRQPTFALNTGSDGALKLHSNAAYTTFTSSTGSGVNASTVTLSSEGIRLLYELFNTFQTDGNTRVKLMIVEESIVFSCGDFYVHVLGLDASMTPTLYAEGCTEGSVHVQTHLLTKSLNRVDVTDDKSFDLVQLELKKSGEMAIRFANGQRVEAQTSISVDNDGGGVSQCFVSRRMLMTALNFFHNNHQVKISNLGDIGRACVLTDDTSTTTVYIPKKYGLQN